jgi:hypothetical protein
MVVTMGNTQKTVRVGLRLKNAWKMAKQKMKNVARNFRNKTVALSLIGALAGGCGDTINNHYHYYGPDAGSNDATKDLKIKQSNRDIGSAQKVDAHVLRFDSSSPDAVIQDSRKPITCKPTNKVPDVGTLPPLAGDQNGEVKIVAFENYSTILNFDFYKRMLTLRSFLANQTKAAYYHRDSVIGIGDYYCVDAALAVRCANEQNKFVEMYDFIFSNQTKWNSLSGAQLNSVLEGFALSIALDLTVFKNCISSKKYLQDVTNDENAVQNLNIAGTPITYVIFPNNSPADLSLLDDILSGNNSRVELRCSANHQIFVIDGISFTPGKETSVIVEKILKAQN